MWTPWFIYAYYFVTHICPILLLIYSFYQLRSKKIHYDQMYINISCAYGLYLCLLASAVTYLTSRGFSHCCDSTVSLMDGLVRDSGVFESWESFVNFIKEGKPNHGWPSGYKSTFRSIILIIAFLLFFLAVISNMAVHGLPMLLTFLTYPIVLTVAIHLPLLAGTFFVWVICLYYVSRAFRRKYYESYNISDDPNDIFGDHPNYRA
jgi:hypothetical protein